LRVLGQAEILPRPLEPVLMRLIQEAVINVGKHAHPRLVDVTLDLRSVDQVTLTVQDDGVGFDLACLAEAAQHGHYGLTQMRERVASLRGRFTIDSQPGQGTLVRVVLPFQATP
jgi:signal transduction histidine kinase